MNKYGHQVPEALEQTSHRIGSDIALLNTGFDPDKGWPEHEVDLDHVWTEKVEPNLPLVEKYKNLQFARCGWFEDQERLGDVPVNVLYLPIFNNLKNNTPLLWQAYETSELTQSPTIVVDTPSQQDKQQPIFVDAAKQSAQLLKHMGVKIINIAGNSMAAEHAAELAKIADFYGIKVQAVFVTGAPRIEARSIKKLYRDLRAQDATYKSAQLYPFDAELTAASLHDRAGTPAALGSYLRGVGVSSLWRYIFAMKELGFEDALETAMWSQPEMRVTFGINNDDTVGRKAPLMAVKNHLSCYFAGRVRAFIYPGGDHGVADRPFYPTDLSIAFTGRADNRIKSPTNVGTE